MSLIQKIKTGIPIVAMGLYSACSIPRELDSSEFLKGHKISEVDTARDFRYSLDTIAIAGKEYVAKSVKPEMTKTGEGKFILYPLENSNIVLTNKKLGLERETTIVPTEWDRDKDGKTEYELKFRTEGPYNVKAEIKKRNSDKLMSSGRITQEDLSQKIKTCKIGESEYYVGITLTDENKIENTLIMEKNGEEILINTTTGQITIRGNPVYALTERQTIIYEAERKNIAERLDAAKRKETKAKEALEEMKEKYGDIPIVESKKEK